MHGQHQMEYSEMKLTMLVQVNKISSYNSKDMIWVDYRIGNAEETEESKLDFRTNAGHFPEREVKAEKENDLRKKV